MKSNDNLRHDLAWGFVFALTFVMLDVSLRIAAQRITCPECVTIIGRLCLGTDAQCATVMFDPLDAP